MNGYRSMNGGCRSRGHHITTHVEETPQQWYAIVMSPSRAVSTLLATGEKADGHATGHIMSTALHDEIYVIYNGITCQHEMVNTLVG